MTEISAGFKRRLEYVLDQICNGTPDGGGHEMRKFVAEKLIEAAEAGVHSVEGLTEIANQALAAPGAPAMTKTA